MKRTNAFILRLNEKELQSLQCKVDKSGLSREAYIRQLIGGHVPRELPPIEYHKMINELNAIGVNLNQIAACANATGEILADKYRENYRLLMKKVIEIQQAVTLPEKL